MKRLFILLLLPFLFAACEEDYIGQYPVDSVPPSKVSNPEVENLPGKAVITYNLPKDTDLLYVKAVYKDARGNTKQVRASNFKNRLELKGFAKSAKQTVSLISVDRSQNESEALNVEIEPLDSPIYEIMNSVNVEPTWGGLKVSWSNPEKEQIFMYITTPTESGDSLITTAINSDAEGFLAVHGQKAVETEFDVVIRDIYENYTDTVKHVILPLHEEFITPEKFILTALAKNMNWHKSRNNAGALFDGVKSSDKPIYMETKVKIDGVPYSYFSVDLGDVYKFSRIKFWGRVAYCYQLHCPRHFRFWGTTSEEAASDPNNWDGWEMLYEGWSHKPSGDDTSDVTAEDKEAALAGEEYEIPESAGPVRYFRFECLETWTKSTSLNLNEMEFYGAKYGSN